MGWFWLMGKQEFKQQKEENKNLGDRRERGFMDQTLIYVPSPCLSHLKLFLLLSQKSKTELETEVTFLEMIYPCLLEVEAVDYGIFWTWNEADEIFQSRKSPKMKHFFAL